MLDFALEASNHESKLELTEMAVAFQRLALREEERASDNVVEFAAAKSA